MPRKPMPWFRLYVSAVRDTKLRRLPAAQRWVWVAALTAARESCQPGYLLVSERQPMTDRDIADLAAVTLSDARKALAAFHDADMIDRDDTVHAGAWHVTNWDSRQYQSDNTTERTRKHRTKERSNDVPDPLQGTANGSSAERFASGTENRDTDPDLHPPPTDVGTRPEPGGGGLVDQAVQLAAKRYGRNQVAQGKGSSPDGLANWWLQENAEGARVRGEELLTSHKLTLTQLADVLLEGNPRWLDACRRRNGEHVERPDPDAMVALAAAARDAVEHPRATRAS